MHKREVAFKRDLNPERDAMYKKRHSSRGGNTLRKTKTNITIDDFGKFMEHFQTKLTEQLTQQVKQELGVTAAKIEDLEQQLRMTEGAARRHDKTVPPPLPRPNVIEKVLLEPQESPIRNAPEFLKEMFPDKVGEPIQEEDEYGRPPVELEKERRVRKTVRTKHQQVLEVLEQVLTEESLDPDLISKRIGEPIQEVHRLLKQLKDEDKVYNVGYEDVPIWTWKVGADSPKLKAVIKRLISERPMLLQDLERATGASQKRCDAVMSDLKRRYMLVDIKLRDRGKMYFLMDERVKDARIEPKTVNGKKVIHGARSGL